MAGSGEGGLAEGPERLSSKLSPQARKLLQDRRDSPEGSATVEVLIRVKDPDREGWRENLEATGASVRTVAGDVCTATVAVAALSSVVELQDVMALEVSTPLHPEPPPTG